MTSVPMPTPPGGLLTCDSGQMGIVIVDGRTGEISASCQTPPPGATGPGGGHQLRNWALGIITRRPRTEDQMISWEESALLDSGVYEAVTATGQRLYVCYFTLPQEGEEPTGQAMPM